MHQTKWICAKCDREFDRYHDLNVHKGHTKHYFQHEKWRKSLIQGVGKEFLDTYKNTGKLLERRPAYTGPRRMLDHGTSEEEEGTQESDVEDERQRRDRAKKRRKTLRSSSG